MATRIERRETTRRRARENMVKIEMKSFDDYSEKSRRSVCFVVITNTDNDKRY